MTRVKQERMRLVRKGWDNLEMGGTAWSGNRCSRIEWSDVAGKGRFD